MNDLRMRVDCGHLCLIRPGKAHVFRGMFVSLLVAVTLLLGGASAAAEPAVVVDIGSRRELFVDRLLIDRLEGTRLVLHHPQPAGEALRFERPWEGVFAGYVTVIKDGPVYRLYYRGLATVAQGQAAHGIDKEFTCYAESRDGITFERPTLGLFEFNGSRDNNVILARSVACHNFTPFLDTRPGVPPDERFKAVGGNMKMGLLPFVSADGIHWRPLWAEPIITRGAFDSQNLAFWSESEEAYVCYFRTGKRVGEQSYRWISRCTSPDFLQWSEPVEMSFGDAPPEQYYTNQTQPYFHASHIYVAIFARFWPERRVITGEQAAQLGVVGDYAGDCSDAVFMTTRGGEIYHREFLESFVRPGPGPGNWVSRTNYPALGIVPTAEGEMSCYVQRYYAQPSHYLERLALRTDGFVSVNAPYQGGELLTRPLRFQGKTLEINFATSAAGQIQVEIQDAAGKPVPGFTLAEAIPMIGDRIAADVAWQGGEDISLLAGQPIRLRFVMRDADLYAIRFHCPPE